MPSVKDLVCGMTVDTLSALSAEHGGTTYYFCGDGCRSNFLAEPRKYLAGGPA